MFGELGLAQLEVLLLVQAIVSWLLPLLVPFRLPKTQICQQFLGRLTLMVRFRELLLKLHGHLIMIQKIPKLANKHPSRPPTELPMRHVRQLVILPKGPLHFHKVQLTLPNLQPGHHKEIHHQ